MEWQALDDAPNDKPILTDDGLVIFQTDHGRWAHCDRSGNTFDCADNGTYTADPTVWMPLPDSFYA